MRHARNAVFAVLALVLVVVLSFGWATSTSEPARAQEEACFVQIDGSVALVICGGEVVQTLQLPTVQVTEKIVETIIREIKVPIPGPTIRIQGPTETVTVTLPGHTHTETPPAETVYPPAETRTVQPSETPTETVTVTPTTGQDEGTDGKVSIDSETETDRINFHDSDVTLVEASLGTVAVLLLVALLLTALYAGYTLGWKDKERKDTEFIGDILDESKLRRDLE